MSAQSSVYVGVWTDWSSSSIPFNTLTLPVAWGGILVAFLAMYVRTAGKQFWNVVRFTAHQIGAHGNRHQEEAPFLQQQAILRNSSTPTSAALRLGQLSFAWRKSKSAKVGRACRLMLLACLHSIVFALAGLLSSRVTKPGSQDVLITGGNCGMWEVPEITEASNQGWQLKVLNDSITAATYARNCYKGGNSLLGCNSYVVDNIPWTVNANESCPFASGMCYGGDTAAYSMDTGPMDTLAALGINTRQTLTYQHKRTCAPILTDGFGRLENLTTEDAGNMTVDRMYFGSMGGNNYTNQYLTESVQVQIGYGMNSYVAYPDVEDTWLPVAELNRTDADVTLIFLNQNSIRYNDPVDDPFFSAHIYNNASADNIHLDWYESDYYTTAIGCVDQAQICNPSAGACTPLADYNTVENSIFSGHLDLSATQLAVVKRVVTDLLFQTAYYAVNGRGGDALRANELVYSLNSAALPNNQWQIEVDGWFGVSLARLQQSVVQYASGPTNLPFGGVVVAPLPGADTAVCGAQKVKGSSAYQNFDFVAVMVAIGVCSLVAVLGLMVDTCVACLQGKGSSAKVAWKLDYLLQLQRMAWEGAGYGRWERLQKIVPVLSESERVSLGRYVIGADGEYAGIESKPTVVRDVPKGENGEQEAMLGYTGYTEFPVQEDFNIGSRY